MKIFYQIPNLFILFFTCMVIFSCQEEVILEQKSIDNSPIQTRALSIDEPSVSNPDLHNNWENITTLFLNGGGDIDAPWVYKEGVSMNIPLNYRTDVKKEDGWTMLSHTLIRSTSREPNYILLYNKKTGVLKGFYYNENPENNNSFLWAMEATSPTSIFPSNELLQKPLNSTYKYITTSNIVEQSTFEFSELNAGWNAFSFELSYGTVNNNPVISIKGYNNQQSLITGSGKYSGEVIIPVAGGATGFASMMSVLQGTTGVTATFLSKISTVKEAIGLVGTVLGNTSLYKKSATNIRATSSGKFNLEASSFSSLGGMVFSLNNITLRRLNGNNDLGLWALSKNPTYICNKYNKAYGSGTNYTASIGMNCNELISTIIINPLVKSSIADYKVISTQFFVKTPNQYSYIKLADNIYCLDYSNKGSVSLTKYTDWIPTPKTNCYITPKDSFCVNITVEFTYNDGSTFISSRNFDANIRLIDNSSILKSPYIVL